MYQSRTVTDPDGTKRVICTFVREETRTAEQLKEMERMSRAIEAFGTSA